MKIERALITLTRHLEKKWCQNFLLPFNDKLPLFLAQILVPEPSTESSQLGTKAGSAVPPAAISIGKQQKHSSWVQPDLDALTAPHVRLLLRQAARTYRVRWTRQEAAQRNAERTARHIRGRRVRPWSNRPATYFTGAAGLARAAEAASICRHAASLWFSPATQSSLA